MSAELFLNNDKNPIKSTANGISAKTSISSEKKEGTSLFDSLMQEAKSTVNDDKTPNSEEKKDVKSTVNNDKTPNSEEKKETKNTVNDDKNLNSEEKKETKNSVTKEKNLETEEKKESKNSFTEEKKLYKNISTEEKLLSKNKENETPQLTDTKEKISTSDIEKTPEETKNTSIKKLVDKLVNIVVNAAKEIFDKNSGKELSPSELTKTIEKLVDVKLNSLDDKSKLKVLMNEKLNIVGDSLEIIKKEVKSLINNKELKNDVSSSEVKTVLLDEVKSVKENIKDIKKEIVAVEGTKKNEPIINDKAGTKSDKIEINKKIINDIDNTISSIDEDTDDIEVLISKINKNDNKNDNTKDSSQKEDKELKVIKEKVDHKVETIKESIVEIKDKVSDIIIVNTTNKEVNITKENGTKKSAKQESSDLDGEKPLIAKMFLNAQKTSKEQTSLEQVKDAKINILDKKTIESVKSSAEKLELNIEDTDVKHLEEEGKKPISKDKADELKTNTLINNKSLNKVLIHQKVEANNVVEIKNNVNMSSVKEDDKAVEIVVPKEIIPTLQNKIISAQQKVGSFMSDVARNMYLNYKPPVTAFRVNLNPANLGSISIIMKANKIDNSLTVSMNLSNSNTMEAFTENKAVLQNAIQRQFNESSNVSIDFNMQDKNSEQQFSQEQQRGNQNANDADNQTTNESNEDEEKELIANNDYM